MDKTYKSELEHYEGKEIDRQRYLGSLKEVIETLQALTSDLKSGNKTSPVELLEWSVSVLEGVVEDIE